MEYLDIIALGNDQNLVTTSLTELITKYECNIMRLRFSTLGAESATMVIVTGNRNAVDKLESALEEFGESSNATIVLKRTEQKNPTPSAIPYNIQVVGIDDSIIIHEIFSFFTEQNIPFEDIYLETATSHITDTALFNLSMTAKIPTETNLNSIREEFIGLCDELNVDGGIEPDKSH
ncbi:MAG: hypothetical protein M1561_07925 [Gammaproteobacteria bacterium]|nr:hypothetical protein [Gammaproteobacteria bacterium]